MLDLVWFGVTMTLALIVAVMESLLCRTYCITRWYWVLGMGPSTTPALVSSLQRMLPLKDVLWRSVITIYLQATQPDVLQETIG